jgi:quercetin dioxygenase-like cupin family protein
MAEPFTRVSLAAVDDAAPGNGFGDRWEARVARDALAAERTGVTLFRLLPGKRSPFTHRHTGAEEIYVVLSGSGRVKLGDELFRVPLTGAAIWTVREAKVVRAEFYADRSEGLAAAGLAE